MSRLHYNLKRPVSAQPMTRGEFDSIKTYGHVNHQNTPLCSEPGFCLFLQDKNNSPAYKTWVPLDEFTTLFEVIGPESPESI